MIFILLVKNGFVNWNKNWQEVNTYTRYSYWCKIFERYRSVEEKTQQPRSTEVNNAGFLSFYLLLHSLYEKIYVLWDEVSRGNREEPFQDILWERPLNDLIKMQWTDFSNKLRKKFVAEKETDLQGVDKKKKI